MRVRYLAEHTARTHRDFAGLIGLEPTKLSKSLHGTRRFRTEELLAVAECTGVPTDWLLHGSGATPTVRGARSAPPLPVRSGEARRRLEILDTVWRLIARNGYRIRLDDLASACGTTAPALRHYFPNKGQLLQSALLHCAERAFARQQEELESIPNARDALLVLIDQLLPTAGQARDEWLVWLQVATQSALRPELRSVHNDFHRRWLELVADVVRRGLDQQVYRCADPEQFAVEFMSMGDGLAIRLLTATPGYAAERMREILLGFARGQLEGAGDGIPD